MAKTEALTSNQADLVASHVSFAKRLAAFTATKKKAFGFDTEEFESAAYLGLCDAARRFNAEKGMNFETFAYFRIQGAMADMLRNEAGVRRRQYNRLTENATVGEEFESEVVDGTEASSAEIKKEIIKFERLPFPFARSGKELAQLLEIIDEVDMRLHCNSDGSMDLAYDRELNPEEFISGRNTRRYLKDLIERLPENEKTVIKLRYFEEESLDALTVKLGNVSRSWVSRLHSKAIEHLRSYIAADETECACNAEAAARHSMQARVSPAYRKAA
ncbi:sigma-70 family RNA polymerase sigma factor [bacterium]|nr:sigma-70 family RNA polymerase sigma factor [bacterium]